MIFGGHHCRIGTGKLPACGIAACALAAALCPCALMSQQDERSVRAAFVYNLTKYVVWPSSAQALDICVVGKGAIGSDLKAFVDGKLSGERTIHVQIDTPDLDPRSCEMVYFSAAATSRVLSVLNKTHGTSALTIGEDEDFLRNGGMIAFVRSGDSLQVEVNLDAVQAENLKISSRLLDLAIIFHAGRQG